MNPPSAQLLPPEIARNQLLVVLSTIGIVWSELVRGEIHQTVSSMPLSRIFCEMTSYIMSQEHLSL